MSLKKEIEDFRNSCYYCGRCVKDNSVYWSHIIRATVCSSECEVKTMIQRGLFMIGWHPALPSMDEILETGDII